MAETYEIDGRTVTMPVVVRDASAGTAAFEVDAAAAARLVPEWFTLIETQPGRTQVIVAAIDYRDNDLGDYDEVGITFFVRPAAGPADGSADGTYIWKLPVNQQFTRDAGEGIWGFPKTVESIDYAYTGSSVTVRLEMDGEHVLTLTLPRAGAEEMPPMPMTTYTVIDGRPHATAFTQGGSGSQVLFGGDGVAISLGDHPVAKALAELGLPDSPVTMSTWTEHMQGTFEEPRPL